MKDDKMKEFDITQYEQMHAALRKNEEMYRMVVDNMADVITVMDLNLRFTYVSPSVIRLRGYTAEEVLSQTMEQMLTPESLQVVAKAFEEEMKLEAGGSADPARTRTLELEEYRKDGSTVWLENHMSALRDKEKKLIGIIALSSDISKRKQSEAKIQKQTDAMEAAMDGMAILNENEEYIYLNQAHARIYGYEHTEELIGKSWRILYDADERKRFDSEIMPKFGQTGYWQGEALGTKKDGSKFPQEISLTALGSGGLICIVRDITDRKRTEEDAARAARDWQVTFESTNDAIWILDQDQRVLRSNKTAERFFHRPLGEMIGKPCWEIVHGTAQPIPECPILRVQKSLYRETQELHEGERWLEVIVDPILDAAGRYSGAVHIASDISIRKVAEIELKEKEERFRAIFERSTIGKSLTAPDGKLLRVNEAFADMLGYTIEEIQEFSFAQITHADDVAESRECIRILLAGKQTAYRMEKRYIRKNGDMVWADVSTTLLRDERGTPLYLITSIVDITDRKQSEDEVRLNEARLTSLLKISQYKADSIQELLDFALSEAIMLTGSRIGYIYYYDDQKKEFTLNTWSKDVMKECSVAEPQSIYQLGKTGLWGEAVRQAKPILINDFQAPHPLKRGYPEGHAPLHKFLTLPIFSGDRIVAVVAVANKQTDYDESDIRQLDLMMSSVWKIADRKRVDEQLRETLESLRMAVGVTIQVMVSAVETRDPYTAGHQIRSADLARAIATEMGLPLEKIEGLRMAASIHDIGKLSIPAEILSKPTKLSEIEFSLIKQHARKGFEMLKNVESPWPLAEIVHQHHERMDGSGYPSNLKGDDILIEARILSVADVVEAMASHRPYRPGLGIDAALNEIEKKRGIFYDDAVVDACLRLFREKGLKLAEV